MPRKILETKQKIDRILIDDFIHWMFNEWLSDVKFFNFDYNSLIELEQHINTYYPAGLKSPLTIKNGFNIAAAMYGILLAETIIRNFPLWKYDFDTSDLLDLKLYIEEKGGKIIDINPIDFMIKFFDKRNEYSLIQYYNSIQWISQNFHNLNDDNGKEWVEQFKTIIRLLRTNCVNQN